MQYYLQHFFVPDWKYRELRPAGSGNNSDLHNLGYVQNVIVGQVLARIIPLADAGPDPDPKYVMDTPVLPCGPNTVVSPQRANYLLAAANGYVFYNEGRITVKKLLNVRSDVGFKTGNIFFVGDLAVHGSVKPGFEAVARDVHVMDMIEGGIVRAHGNLLVDGGCKGGAGEHCRIRVDGTMQAGFAEKVNIVAAGNVLIEKYSFFSDIYAGANLIVKGLINGGCIQAYGSVFAAGQVGNRAEKPTQIFVGYNPADIRVLEREESRIAEMSETIRHLQRIVGHLPEETNAATQRLADLVRHREDLIRRRDERWKRLSLDESHAEKCRLVVQGTVLPGVEIAIGRAFLRIESPLTNVSFALVDNEIKISALAV